MKRLPAVSRPTFDITGASGDIDARVRAKLRAGEPLYEVDEALLATLAPDVIITQTHCEVCAVSDADLAHGAPARLERQQVVALETGHHRRHPRRVPRRSPTVVGAPDAGRALVDGIRARLAELAAATAPLPHPTVACLEWTAPLFAMGNWGPELIDIAGGRCALGTAGAHSTSVPWQALADADPDVIVIAPCGFGLRAHAGRDAGARRSPRLARPAGRARRPRVRRRRQPLLQPLRPAAVRHAADPRRDPAPRPLPARARRDGVAALRAGGRGGDRAAVQREVERPARVRGLEVRLVGGASDGTGADQIHFAALAPNPPPHGASPLFAISVAALHAESSKSTAVQSAAPASTSGTDMDVRHVASVITSGATPPSESTVSWPMMPRSLPPWLDVFVPRTAMTFLRPG